MNKEKELPPAYPTDGQCSYIDTPPAYADATTPQPVVVAAVVPPQPERNTWTYELFYCFKDVPTCFLGMCCPCVAEVSQSSSLFVASDISFYYSAIAGILLKSQKFNFFSVQFLS